MNDDVILSDKPSLAPILVIWPLTPVLFAVIFAIIGTALNSTLVNTMYVVVELLIIGACAIGLLANLWERQTTLYTLTTMNVVKEWGILTRDEKTIPLENVQVVSVVRPLLGRLLDYGTVVVQAASFGGLRLGSVPRPLEWKRMILESAPAKASGEVSRQSREGSRRR